MEVMASGVQSSVYKLKANCNGWLQLGLLAASGACSELY